MFSDSIDPLTDPRWRIFVEGHPEASIFHQPSWLEALRKTYRLRPLVFTTARPGEPLRDGLVFCPVRSWITGKRLVTLPFSDHCNLLADSEESHKYLSAQIAQSVAGEFEYAEVRSTVPSKMAPPDKWQPGHRFLRHSLSLSSLSEEIFRGFHKNCIQRKIRRAEREGVRYVNGRSASLLRHFYDLQLRTRRRHRVPPQPFRWFQNLVSSMGPRLTIHVAFKDERAAAAILTLTHRNTLTYKYGCSDERLNNLGGMPFLFWQAIQEAKDNGLEVLDLGRTEISNDGLIAFKERLGASPSPLTYWTYTAGVKRSSRRDGVIDLADRVLPRLPESLFRLPRSLLALGGSMIYPHLD